MKFLILSLLLVSPVANASTSFMEGEKMCRAIGKIYIQATFTKKGMRKAHCRKVNAPKCSDTSENCLAKWYRYGDITGDYGIIDAAE